LLVSTNLLNLADGFNCVAFVDTSYLNADMCKSKSQRSHESKAKSADSSKACNKPRAFSYCTCLFQIKGVFFLLLRTS